MLARLILIFALVAIVPPAWAQEVDRAAEAAAIRKIDEDWVAAVKRKDAAAVGQIYAEDAVFMVPNAPQHAGRDKVTEAWAGLMGLPNVELSFAPTTVEVSQSGDMAYDIGTYKLAFDGEGGRRVEDAGKYVVVWRKVDGAWKVAADILNSDLPAQ